MYQLWLDDLYPRAKFMDALAIIEKLGHTKKMQIMRKAWIDEGKPKDTDYQGMEMDPDGNNVDGIPLDTANDTEQSERALVNGETIDDRSDNDELFLRQPDAEPQQQRDKQMLSTASLFVTDEGENGESAGDQPPADDLDALLAEDVARESIRGEEKAQPRKETFDDEMQAIADLGDFW